MRRKEGVAALAAGAVIVLALLAVFAVQLSTNQAKSRSDIESQAHERARLVTGLLAGVFAQDSRPTRVALRAYGAAHVPDAALQANLGDNAYLALLAPDGRVLAHTGAFDDPARASTVGPGAVAMVRAGRPWALGNVRADGNDRVINLAARLHTAAGPRILLTGFHPDSLSAFVTGQLRQIPGVQSQHQLLVDGNGIVIGSTVAMRPPGYHFHTPAQLRILSHGSGIVNGRYFDQVPMPDTPWKLVLTVPEGAFFATVSGARQWLPWVIFAAFGLVAVGLLLLMRRSLRDAERIQVANAELERRARELVRSNTELDQFASIASHDLQEPLRKVRTFTERVTETEGANLTERGADDLRRANASAERMQTLIEDLLEYARVSTRGRPFAPVDLRRVAEDVLDDLSERIAASGAEARVGQLPTISADPRQMRQLLQNLISNAVKFHREGVTPLVQVDAAVQHGWATITVRDNGIGFEPQYSQRIFRVFERLHGPGAYPGTGIGLALCRKIAERHGGTVVAESVAGRGSTFTVTLQTERDEAVSDAPPDRTAPASPVDREDPYVPA